MISLYLGVYTGILVNPKYATPPIESLYQWRNHTKMSWVECSDNRASHLRDNQFSNHTDILERFVDCSKYSNSPDLVCDATCLGCFGMF